MMRPLVPILLYHSISADATPGFWRWTVHPDLFAAHMAFLRDHQYTSLTAAQFAQTLLDPGRPLPERPVVITFDDGFADFGNALPVLKSMQLTATLYIVTGYVGDASRWLAPEGEGDRPMLTWSQILEIDASGIECGAHSRTHPQLDVLQKTRAWDEISRSKEEMEQHLGHLVNSFAYPHGYYSPAVRRMVEQAGFTSACGVKHAMSAMNDDRFGLARIIVAADTSVQDLSRLLEGQGLAVAPHERMRTVGWRLFRRSVGMIKHYAVQEKVGEGH
jgi:peptidoglycan/xylan/chitin deacetylase (PgdA/CDA1 family)